LKLSEYSKASDKLLLTSTQNVLLLIFLTISVFLQMELDNVVDKLIFIKCILCEHLPLSAKTSLANAHYPDSGFSVGGN